MIHLLLYGILAFLVFWLLKLTWPICAMLVVASVVLGMLDKNEAPWAKAARGILGPTCIGLVLLALLLLVLNLLQPDQQDLTVGTTEQLLLRTSAALAWARLSWPSFALLIAALIVLGAYLPRWRLLSRFLTLKKRMGQASTAVGV